MSSGARAEREGPVLMSMRSRGINPYLDLLHANLRQHGVQVLDDTRYFSRRLARWPGPPPDYVHYHWPEHRYGHRSRPAMLAKSAWFFSALSAMRASGTRVIFTLHNELAHENAWPERHHAARARMIAMSDVVLINFEAAREHLRDRYGRTEHVFLAPHGSYRGYYPDTVTRADARVRLGLPGDTFVFLAFGELRPYKNTLDIIAAFRDLAAPDARLLIAGRARDPHHGARVAAAAQADPRILLVHRPIPDGEVQLFFRAADVLVLGQDTFTSGSAVLGLDFGLPLLALRRNHVAEIAQGASLIDLAAVSPDGLRDGMARALSADLSLARADALRSSEALAWEPIARRLAADLRAHWLAT